MLQTNTIHHLDFFQAYSNDWLKFKLKRIDLIIADPPYGIRAKYGRNNKTIQNDEDLDTYYNFLSAANDILGNIGTLVTFCSEKKLADVMSFISLNTSFVYRHCAIYKTNIGLGGRIRNEYDFILIYTKDHELMPQKDFRLFQLEKPVNTKDKQHPHKKDYSVIRDIIKTFSRPDSVILDPFSGSGTVAKICVIDNVEFIAFEIDDQWYEDSINELKHIQRQNNFFNP